MFISKGLKTLGSALVPILIFSQTAMAAPSMITYTNAGGQTVSVNYLTALTTPAMKTALTTALSANYLANLPVFVTDDGGAKINYIAAVNKGENYVAALADSAVNNATIPTATSTISTTGTIVPVGATIVSVAAVTGATTAGTAYALPATVTATMSDGTTTTPAVTWATVLPASYASAGTYTVIGTIAGTSVTATATVTVNAVGIVTVSSVSAVPVTTVVGTAPNLPATVSAKMSNGTTSNVGVTWATVTASQYAAVGSFAVTGTIAGTSVTATANVTVNAAPVLTVTSLGSVSSTTTVGTAGSLPSTVTATMSDGSTQSVSVVWATVSASNYAATGTYTVLGTIAQSTTLKAVATVTVNPASVVTVVSINPVVGATIVGTPYALPTTVTANMSNSTTQSCNVTWAAVTPSNYASVGSYTVVGTIAQSATVTATATVTVNAIGTTTLTSVNAITANAAYGTSEVSAKAALPGTVMMNLANGTTQIAYVTWADSTNYNATTPGSYTYVGTVTLPSLVTNPNSVTATATVTVQAQSAQAITGVITNIATDGSTIKIGGITYTVNNVIVQNYLATAAVATAVTNLTSTIQLDANGKVTGISNITLAANADMAQAGINAVLGLGAPSGLVVTGQTGSTVDTAGAGFTIAGSNVSLTSVTTGAGALAINGSAVTVSGDTFGAGVAVGAGSIGAQILNSTITGNLTAVATAVTATVNGCHVTGTTSTANSAGWTMQNSVFTGAVTAGGTGTVWTGNRFDGAVATGGTTNQFINATFNGAVTETAVVAYTNCAFAAAATFSQAGDILMNTTFNAPSAGQAIGVSAAVLMDGVTFGGTGVSTVTVSAATALSLRDAIVGKTTNKPSIDISAATATITGANTLAMSNLGVVVGTEAKNIAGDGLSLSSVAFTGAFAVNLTGKNVTVADCTTANDLGVSGSGFIWTGSTATKGVIGGKLVLTGANSTFTGGTLTGLMTGSTGAGAKLTNMTFNGAVVVPVAMSSVDFESCTFNGATFENDAYLTIINNGTMNSATTTIAAPTAVNGNTVFNGAVLLTNAFSSTMTFNGTTFKGNVTLVAGNHNIMFTNVTFNTVGTDITITIPGTVTGTTFTNDTFASTAANNIIVSSAETSNLVGGTFTQTNLAVSGGKTIFQIANSKKVIITGAVHNLTTTAFLKTTTAPANGDIDTTGATSIDNTITVTPSSSF